MRAVGVDHPDAVDLLPWAFVAIHQQFGIGGRKQQVVDPIGGVQQNFDVAGHFAVGAGLKTDGEKLQRQMRGETPLHHLALVERLIVRSLLGAGYAIVAASRRRWRARRPVLPVLLVGPVAFIKRAGGEGFISIDADDHVPRGQVDELADRAGIHVGLVDGSDICLGIRLGVEDAVGFESCHERVDAKAEKATRPRRCVGGARRIGNQQTRLHGLHVHGVDAVGRGVDHGLVVGGVAIDVEVETAGVGLIGEPPDAMAGVLVDPGLRRGGLRSLGGDGKRLVRGQDRQGQGEVCAAWR